MLNPKWRPGDGLRSFLCDHCRRKTYDPIYVRIGKDWFHYCSRACRKAHKIDA